MDNAEKLLELAKEKKAITPAEEKLFRAAATGEIANYSAGSEKDNDPEKANEWGKKRVLKADRIAWLCTDKQASDLVSHLGIFVKGARIDGNLELQYAKILFPLSFEKSAFQGGINLRHAEILELNLPGTHTGSISADGLKVQGGVFLRNGFKAEGEVCLPGATIGGDFDCIKGQFINPEGNALMADRLKVGGNVFLRNGFKARGDVRLLGATIGGNLECDDSQFINPKGKALHADNLKVQGNVFMREGFQAKGKVDFTGATIDGHFIWTDVDSAEEAELDLRSASIGTLWDEQESWPDEGKLLLHGFVYNEIDARAPMDAMARIDWLKRQPEFRPQPYEQLAAVLRKSGHIEEAKKILIAKENEKLRQRKGFVWLLNWLFGLLIGYGYRPWRVVGIGFVIVLLGCGLFWAGFDKHALMQTKDVKFISEKDSSNSNAEKQIFKNYPKFNAFIYSLDVFLPLVDLHQSSYWLPDANRDFELVYIRGFSVRISGSFLYWYIWFEILSGWVITTLLVASITRLARG